MVPLEDFGTRAMECSGCHVGAPADKTRGYPIRNMNHDMIAAGHPRLNFDFHSYSRLIRPHWYEPLSQPGVETQKWLIGRVVQAEALSKLHLARGSMVELSEYNCFACHHDLTLTNWRGQTLNYYRGRTPGSLVWQLPWPLDKPGVVNEDELATIKTFAEKSWQHDPKPAMAALSKARLRLMQEGPISPAIFLKRVCLEKDELVRLDWDQACGLYQALYAVTLDLAASGTQLDVMNDFDELAKILYLPGRQKSQSRRFDSPAEYTPSQMIELFEQLQEKLRTAAAP
jgi:hypothetical protein